MDSMPRISVGKLNKKVIRAEYAELYVQAGRSRDMKSRLVSAADAGKPGSTNERRFRRLSFPLQRPINDGF